MARVRTEDCRVVGLLDDLDDNITGLVNISNVRSGFFALKTLICPYVHNSSCTIICSPMMSPTKKTAVTRCNGRNHLASRRNNDALTTPTVKPSGNMLELQTFGYFTAQCRKIGNSLIGAGTANGPDTPRKARLL